MPPIPVTALRVMMRGILLLGLLLLPATATADVRPDVSALYALMQERLSLMPAVAAHKWRSGEPIEDLDRERVVLAAAIADGLHFGITRASSTRLFEAQIAAAKAVQGHAFEAWQGGAPLPPADDLVAVLRPRLSALGERILAGAGALPDRSVHDRALFEQLMAVPGLTPEHVDALFDAVTSIQRYPDRLQQVLDAGVLRVGTTGDYRPFSYTGANGALAGIDVDLARDLAGALGVRLELVATSWPALMGDLAAGRYDVAMSGVSRTLGRARHAYLSAPYHVGGKTPIARCDRREPFASLADIDRPGVRVVVNPGGTNQVFVDAHIHSAEVIVHPDNRTIFDELVAGRADVMITDRIEVVLQTGRRPELCATMTGNLNYQEKAYLMPPDDRWREFVATWLSLALAEGRVAAAFRAHGVEAALPVSGARVD
jgi:cyclohexadienyl dehydratase